METNKYIYSALAFFLGGLGIHKFYVKQNKKAYFIYYFVGQVYQV